jgi:hypothetical protein
MTAAIYPLSHGLLTSIDFGAASVRCVLLLSSRGAAHLVDHRAFRSNRAALTMNHTERLSLTALPAGGHRFRRIMLALPLCLCSPPTACTYRDLSLPPLLFGDDLLAT